MRRESEEDRIFLFTDGSVDNLSKIGYGAYLVIHQAEIQLDSLKSRIRVKRFENSSSTKLELQTLLWALSDIGGQKENLVVFTDSQNLTRLLSRRSRMEQNNFHTNDGKVLKLHALYQRFFELSDQFQFKIIKIPGHQRSNQKGDIGRIFSYVDQAARKALKKSRSGE